MATRMKADEIAVLIEQVLGYQMQHYLCPQVPTNCMLKVLDHLHIIHAELIHLDEPDCARREEHWLLRLPPEDEADVPEYVWRIVDLLVAHDLRPFWFWVAERVPADDQPVDPQPLYCFSFDGRHVIAL